MLVDKRPSSFGNNIKMSSRFRELIFYRRKSAGFTWIVFHLPAAEFDGDESGSN